MFKTKETVFAQPMSIKLGFQNQRKTESLRLKGWTVNLNKKTREFPTQLLHYFFKSGHKSNCHH